jgi:hypothetical protein
MNGEDILQGVITEIFSPLYGLAVACTFVYFLYGGFRFIVDLNDPEKKNNGKSHLLWGTVGLFIIFSVGGILKFFNEVFGGLFQF